MVLYRFTLSGMQPLFLLSDLISLISNSSLSTLKRLQVNIGLPLCGDIHITLMYFNQYHFMYQVLIGTVLFQVDESLNFY